MLSPALRSFHDKVYVLTTPAATERQQGVIDELGEGNFEFVYSIDKQTTSIEEMERSGTYKAVELTSQAVDRTFPPMTLGHICCALGHRMVWEKFLETDAEWALIFEDDVVPHDVAEKDIQAAVRHIPPDAEIVYWGWWLGRFRPWTRIAQQGIDHVRSFLGLYPDTHAQIKNRFMKRHNKYFHTSAGNYLLHAYTLSRSGAEKLIELNTPIVMNSDHVPIKAIEHGHMQGYVAITELFWQRSHELDDAERSMTRDDGKRREDE